MAPLRWVQFRTLAELLCHESAWRELCAEAAEPNIFFEPTVLVPAWQHLAAGAAVQVWAALEPHGNADRFVGLVPIELRRNACGLRLARFWQHLHCSTCVPLVRDGYHERVFASLLEHLRREATLLEMPRFPGDGPFWQVLVELLLRQRRPWLLREAFTRAVFRRGSSAEEYLADYLSTARRKKLRRLSRRLAERGPLEIRELAPHADVGPWVDQFLALEQKSWKYRAGTALCQHPAEMAFFRDVAAAAHRRRQLRILAMYLDNRPIAMIVDLLSGTMGFSFKSTYDESFASFSPGILLDLESLHRLHQPGEPLHFDSCSTPGSMSLKTLWRHRRLMVELLIALRPALGGAALAALAAGRWLRALGRRLCSHDSAFTTASSQPAGSEAPADGRVAQTPTEAVVQAPPTASGCSSVERRIVL
ncbi:MAG: GNAT family N-acetyltransferase [Gemmataceae bacterium]|nr:GNAT family N-acetyltransferase [Gemmataceae bacterium]